MGKITIAILGASLFMLGALFGVGKIHAQQDRPYWRYEEVDVVNHWARCVYVSGYGATASIFVVNGWCPKEK